MFIKILCEYVNSTFQMLSLHPNYAFQCISKQKCVNIGIPSTIMLMLSGWIFWKLCRHDITWIFSSFYSRKNIQNKKFKQNPPFTQSFYFINVIFNYIFLFLYFSSCVLIKAFNFHQQPLKLHSMASWAFNFSAI